MGEDSKAKEMMVYIDGQPVDMANISEITLTKTSAVGCSEILNPVTASESAITSIFREQAEDPQKVCQADHGAVSKGGGAKC